MENSKSNYNTWIVLIFFLLITCVVLYIYMDFFCKEQAIKKSKDKGNIYYGCLYLEKKFSDKNGYVDYKVNIDGRNYLLRKIFIGEFPFANDYGDFKENIKKDISCYRIEYIKVDMFFIEKRYIYSLVKK